MTPSEAYAQDIAKRVFDARKGKALAAHYRPTELIQISEWDLRALLEIAYRHGSQAKRVK
jgi:hypothetical protein